MSMAKKIDLSIVIPVHNEEKILKKQISKLQREFTNNKNNIEVIIIENGSTDNTKTICHELARGNEITTIHLNKANYGLALKKGFLAASGNFIINFDIDYMDFNFAAQALALAPFGYDIIIASKNLRVSKDNRVASRRVISSIYKYVLYYLFGLRVSDTHGIKLWNNDNKFQNLIGQTKYTKEIFDTELIIRSQYAGRNILELPTVVNEMRNSVTYILPRAIKGFLDIANLWITLRVLSKAS